MEWKNLFERYILERGYDYYDRDAVEKLNVYDDIISADVIGTEGYEVEIYLGDGDISGMYCSCPYAATDRNCKHMAAVLYKWSETKEKDKVLAKNSGTDGNLFVKASTTKEYKKKADAIQKLVEDADITIVRSYLTSILAENEKLLLRFNAIASEQITEEDITCYMNQIDDIAADYLRSNDCICYYESEDFVAELAELLDNDVHRMMDYKQYMGAFEVMNYIFELVGTVDMDTSNGVIDLLADQINLLWIELLTKVSNEEKQRMFQWFTTFLNETRVDVLNEYIENIIMDEFNEKEYVKQKFLFIEEMIKKSENMNSEWDKRYNTGRWAERYLSLLEFYKRDKAEVENFCRAYWDNSSVRSYYIDLCINMKEYALALKTIDESISLDKEYKGLVVAYSKKKKDIYLLQGDKEAYIKQLWELVLNYEAGNLEVYKELREQYEKEEWLEKREEIFKKLPPYAHIEKLYKEEKLYDRLLDFVIKSYGVYELHKYAEILRTEYPDEILRKYKTEVEGIASTTGVRAKYQQIVALLHEMQKIKGGSGIVEEMVAKWRVKYKNRPAMMDELERL